MTGTTGHQIFLSYSREDVAFARELRDWLLDQGQRPWMDLFDIPAGARWPDEIDRALQSAGVVLGVLSPASLASENVKNEWDWAIARKKRFVLLMVESCELPFHYVSINYLDFATDRQGAFEALHRSLAQPRDDEEPEQPRPSTHVRPVRRPLRPAGEMVGRERELAQLREQLGAALAGQGSLVLIGGEAGIGKTTLTAAIAAEAEDRGALVLIGGCYDLTTTPPYGPWVEITRRYPDDDDLPTMPEQLREGTGMEGIGSQAALFDLVAGFLSDVANKRPLVLLLEDLHWADAASLDLLRYLGRVLAGQRMLVIATYREDELTRRHHLYQLLPVLTRETQAQRMLLRRLEQDAIDALLETKYQLPADERERLTIHLLQLSEGNPFFVGELLRSLEEESVLSEVDERWQLGKLSDVSVPPVIREVVDGRLNRLGEESRAALEVAAVIGQTVSFELWQGATGLPEDALFGIAEQALQLQVMIESGGGDRLAFSHALIRETLYEGVMNLRRRMMHRQIGELLAEGTRPDPDIVADHFLRGGDGRAVDWLIRAADRAESLYALVLAADRLNQAQELLEDDPDRLRDRGWLLYRIGRLTRQSDTPRALEYFEVSAELGGLAKDDYLNALSRYQQGFMLSWLKNYRDGIDLMLDAAPIMDLLRSDADVPDFARGPQTHPFAQQSGHLVQIIGVGRFGEGIPLFRAWVEQNGEHGDFNLMMATVHSLRGRSMESGIDFARAIALHDARGHYHMAAIDRGLMLLILHLPYRTDQPDEIRSLAEETRGVWEKAAEGGWFGYRPPRNLWYISFHFGDWDDAERQARIAVEDTEYRILSEEAVCCLAAISRHRGNFNEVAALARSIFSEGAATAPGSQRIWSALELLKESAATRLDAGDLDGGMQWLEAYERWMDWCQAVLGRAESSLLWARYHQLAGDFSAARQHGERALNHASNPRQPLALIAANRFLGQLDVVEGRLDEATEHLDASLELAERCETPFERALTLLEIARLGSATGDRDDAHQLLEEVKAICVPLEAQPTLDRVAELEAELAVVDG